MAIQAGFVQGFLDSMQAFRRDNIQRSKNRAMEKLSRDRFKLSQEDFEFRKRSGLREDAFELMAMEAKAFEIKQKIDAHESVWGEGTAKSMRAGLSLYEQMAGPMRKRVQGAFNDPAHGPGKDFTKTFIEHLDEARGMKGEDLSHLDPTGLFKRGRPQAPKGVTGLTGKNLPVPGWEPIKGPVTPEETAQLAALRKPADPAKPPLAPAGSANLPVEGDSTSGLVPLQLLRDRMGMEIPDSRQITVKYPYQREALQKRIDEFVESMPEGKPNTPWRHGITITDEVMVGQQKIEGKQVEDQTKANNLAFFEDRKASIDRMWKLREAPLSIQNIEEPVLDSNGDPVLDEEGDPKKKIIGHQIALKVDPETDRLDLNRLSGGIDAVVEAGEGSVDDPHFARLWSVGINPRLEDYLRETAIPDGSLYYDKGDEKGALNINVMSDVETDPYDLGMLSTSLDRVKGMLSPGDRDNWTLEIRMPDDAKKVDQFYDKARDAFTEGRAGALTAKTFEAPTGASGGRFEGYDARYVYALTERLERALVGDPANGKLDVAASTRLQSVLADLKEVFRPYYFGPGRARAKHLRMSVRTLIDRMDAPARAQLFSKVSFLRQSP